MQSKSMCLIRMFGIVTCILSSVAAYASPAQQTPESIPLELNREIKLKVQSPGIESHGTTNHVVTVTSARFELKDKELIAHLALAILHVEDVDYKVKVTVRDSEGKALGIGSTRVHAKKMILGVPFKTTQNIDLSCGRLPDPAQAKTFSISLSK